MSKKNRKALGHYDYHGAFDPRADVYFNYCHVETFSVGIFRWGTFKNGSLKREKTIYRVKGYIGSPEKVYARAEEICDILDAGGTLDKKSEFVR